MTAKQSNLALASHHMVMSRYQQALDCLQQATAAERENIRFYHMLIDVNFHIDDFLSAKAAATDGLALYPRGRRLLLAVINCCIILDEYVSAEKHLTTALTLHPEYDTFHFQHAYLAWKMGDYDVATERLYNGRKLNPDSPFIHYLNAIIAVRKLKLQTAQRHATKLIEHDLTSGHAYVLLGHILTARERPREAEKCFKRAVELYPDNIKSIPVAHDLAGPTDRPVPFRVSGDYGSQIMGFITLIISLFFLSGYRNGDWLLAGFGLLFLLLSLSMLFGASQWWEFSAEKIKARYPSTTKTYDADQMKQIELKRSYRMRKGHQNTDMVIEIQQKNGETIKIAQSTPSRPSEEWAEMYELTHWLQTNYLDQAPYRSAEIVRAYLT